MGYAPEKMLVAGVVIQAVKDAMSDLYSGKSRTAFKHEIQDALDWLYENDQRPWSFQWCVEQICTGDVQYIMLQIRHFVEKGDRAALDAMTERWMLNDQDWQHIKSRRFENEFPNLRRLPLPFLKKRPALGHQIQRNRNKNFRAAPDELLGGISWDTDCQEITGEDCHQMPDCALCRA